MAWWLPEGQGLINVEVARSRFRPTTLGRIPLDQWTARRRYHYLQNTEATNIHTLSDIRTHNPKKRAPPDLRLRERSHKDPHLQTLGKEKFLPALKLSPQSNKSDSRKMSVQDFFHYTRYLLNPFIHVPKSNSII